MNTSYLVDVVQKLYLVWRRKIIPIAGLQELFKGSRHFEHKQYLRFTLWIQNKVKVSVDWWCRA